MPLSEIFLNVWVQHFFFPFQQILKKKRVLNKYSSIWRVWAYMRHGRIDVCIKKKNEISNDDNANARQSIKNNCDRCERLWKWGGSHPFWWGRTRQGCRSPGIGHDLWREASMWGTWRRLSQRRWQCGWEPPFAIKKFRRSGCDVESQETALNPFLLSVSPT